VVVWFSLMSCWLSWSCSAAGWTGALKRVPWAGLEAIVMCIFFRAAMTSHLSRRPLSAVLRTQLSDTCFTNRITGTAHTHPILTSLVKSALATC
jgi:hypothetical protein